MSVYQACVHTRQISSKVVKSASASKASDNDTSHKSKNPADYYLHTAQTFLGGRRNGRVPFRFVESTVARALYILWCVIFRKIQERSVRLDLKYQRHYSFVEITERY